ncbi:MAG: lipoyl(octanoyl) transferase LipB [Nakamurella sp.]
MTSTGYPQITGRELLPWAIQRAPKLPRSVISVRLSTDPIRVLEPGIVDYHEAWTLQQTLAIGRVAETNEDTVILLEHPSVYTAGKRTQPSDLPGDGTPVIEVDRGGRITWHGPGQLVGYPVVALADPARVVEYVQMLEQVLIDACALVGVAAGRVHGRSGVWLPADDTRPERKVAAIGIRINHGVTQHGFALNCSCDLTEFEGIVPCGITDAGVTSLSAETAHTVSVAEMQPIVKDLLISGLNGNLPIVDVEIPRGMTQGSATP